MASKFPAIFAVILPTDTIYLTQQKWVMWPQFVKLMGRVLQLMDITFTYEMKLNESQECARPCWPPALKWRKCIGFAHHYSALMLQLLVSKLPLHWIHNINQKKFAREVATGQETDMQSTSKLTLSPWFIICRIYISASRALCPQLTEIDGFCNNCSCMYLKSENILTWVGRNLTRGAETQLCNCDSVVIVYFSNKQKTSQSTWEIKDS